MTKFEEEVKRPDNGPITELNNNMQEVFSQYRKMRQYADYLEYELKQKDERIQDFKNALNEASNELSRLSHENGSLKSQLQQQALPVVPGCVAKTVELLKNYPNSSWTSLYESLGEEGVIWLNEYQQNDEKFGFGELNNKLFVLFHLAINGYTVEKTQLFYLKHIDMSKTDKEFDWYLTTNREKLCHNWVVKEYKPQDDDFKFTQQEIDSMETGSYEQIEVHMEDGE